MWSSPRLLKSLVEADRDRERISGMLTEEMKVNKGEYKEEEKETKLWVVSINPCKFKFKFKLV